MAHKKAGGSTSLGRDSESKRLGVKLFAGERASAGNVIVRQRGTRYRAGENVSCGGDDTLFALAEGVVRFKKKKIRKFSGKLEATTYVSVQPKK